MRCWKCKQEMPEGLKYCGNCGVHMNRAVHCFQWLFSKKGLPVLLVIAALILGGAGWAILAQAGSQGAGTDWITIIRTDLYGEDTSLNRAIDDVVNIDLISESETGIVVEVSAPDITDAALEWFSNVSEEEFSNEALENTLLELLKGETTSASFELSIGADGMPVYTDEFLDAASGGVRDFYAALAAMFMEEMEASINE